MSPLRVAIVGMGHVAEQKHMPAWAAAPEAKVVSVVDTRESAAADGARRYGIPKWGTDYEMVLADPDVDAVDLCTPAALHADQVIAALAAGKHVLVEKPLAITVEAAEAMAKAAARSDRVALVTENWIYASASRRARRLLDEGAIGTPHLFHASNETAFSFLTFDRPERSDRNSLGYGFIGGTHTLALARHLMGDLSDVSAFANTRDDLTTPAGVPYDTEMAIACRFESGAIGTMHFTSRSPSRNPIDHTRVFGTRGLIDFDIPTGRVALTRDGVRTQFEDVPPSGGHPEVVAHFLDCVLRGARPISPVGDQAKTIRTLHAAYRSLAARQPVRALA